MSDNISITFTVWDAGCLSGVLQQRIAEAERHRRISVERHSGNYSAEDLKMVDDFIAQMKGCLAAVQVARGRP